MDVSRKCGQKWECVRVGMKTEEGICREEVVGLEGEEGEQMNGWMHDMGRRGRTTNKRCTSYGCGEK
jgi:hypothetical protein